MFSQPVVVPTCHHIKANGVRCGSPALRQRRLCHFHQLWQEQPLDEGSRRHRAREGARNVARLAKRSGSRV